MLIPRAKDAGNGPGLEENLALIRTMFGENSRAISTLAQLLQTPFIEPITPALLRLHPAMGPVAQRSAFPEALRGKAPVNPAACATQFCRCRLWIRDPFRTK